VVFEPDIQPIATGMKGRAKANKITMQLLPPGKAFISNVRHPPGFGSARNFGGTWGSTVGDATIAHEFGHLLGLPDEYEWLPYTDTDGDGRWGVGEPANDDLNHNGVRDPEEPTHPKAEFADPPSIMAEHGGRVLQGHIDEILRARGFMCWKGTMTTASTESLTDNPYLCSTEWETTLEVLVDPTGVASGEALASLAGGPDCNAPVYYTQHTSITFEVHGTASEDRLELQLLGTAYEPPDSLDFGGFAGTLTQAGDPPTLSIPVVAPGLAETEIDLEWASGVNVFRSSSNISLRCEPCEGSADVG
jgi:hypothetical protein